MFCYCAEARRLARTLTARYDAALKPAKLSSAQFETLSFVQSLGPISGRALASRLGTDKTTLSRNLQPMLAAKLLRAETSPDDARQILYSLAATGRARLAKAMPLWQHAHDASNDMLGMTASSSQKSLRHMTLAMS